MDFDIEESNLAVKDDLDATPQQLQLVKNMQEWILNEAEFYGRTDIDFVLTFLRGCKFNEDKAKNKMRLYYKNRIKIPHWFANRDVHRLQHVINKKFTTVLMDLSDNQPLVAITKFSNLLPGDEIYIDDFCQLNSIIMDVVLRRRSEQLFGVIWIIDCKNYPMWLVKALLNFRIVLNSLNGFWLAMPSRLVGIYFVNASAIIRIPYNVAVNLLPKKLKQRVIFFGSSFEKLKELVPINYLPIEYGGQLDDYEKHEDEFVKELMSYAEYIKDDNVYGYQS